MLKSAGVGLRQAFLRRTGRTDGDEVEQGGREGKGEVRSGLVAWGRGLRERDARRKKRLCCLAQLPSALGRRWPWTKKSRARKEQGKKLQTAEDAREGRRRHQIGTRTSAGWLCLF